MLFYHDTIKHYSLQCKLIGTNTVNTSKCQDIIPQLSPVIIIILMPNSHIVVVFKCLIIEFLYVSKLWIPCAKIVYTVQ